MMQLPVRCKHCGCLSIAGLIVPPGVPISELVVPTERPPGIAYCPLCKRIIDDEAFQRSADIFATLSDAHLDDTQVMVLIGLLAEKFYRRASQLDIKDSIGRTVPKAAGVARFIPKGETAGVIALIIATLSLVNDVIFDWIAPALSTKHKSTVTSGGAEITIDQSYVFGKLEPAPKDDLYDNIIFKFSGAWNGPNGSRLWLIVIGKVPPGPIEFTATSITVSELPGRWEYNQVLTDGGSLNWHEYEWRIPLLYVSESGLSITANSSERDIVTVAELQSMSALAFYLRPVSGLLFQIEKMSIDEIAVAYRNLVRHDMMVEARRKSRG